MASSGREQQVSPPLKAWESLVESMPLAVALLHGADHQLCFANRQFRDVTDNRLRIGQALVKALPQFKYILPQLDRLRETRPVPEQPLRLRGLVKLRKSDPPIEWCLQPLSSGGDSDDYIALIAGITSHDRSCSSSGLYPQELDRLAELTTSLLAVRDQDHYLRVNSAFTKLLGWSSEEIMGQAAILFVHPEDRAHTERHIQRLFAGQDLVRFENRLLHKEGSVRCVAWTLAPAPEAGEIYALGRDVTATKEAEQSLRREAETNGFRIALADTLRSLDDSAKIQREAARVIAEYFHVPRVNFALPEADGQHVVVEQEYANGVPSVVGRYSLESYVPANTSLERVYIVSNVEKDPLFPAKQKAAYRRFKIGAIVVVRLVKKGRLKGVLTLADAQTRTWTEVDVTLIEEVAERVWAAIERAETEAALRKSEERYHLMSLATNDVLCDWTAETGALEWNDAALATFGFSLEELGTTIDSAQRHIHPEDREQVVNSLKRALASRDQQSWSEEFRFRKSDGTYLALLSRVHIARDASGNPERVVSSLLDLTERRRVEEALYTANVQLVESDRRKNEFLAMLAHELRNPLAAISNAVQLLGAVTAQAGQRYMTVLQRQVGMLSGIVDDLLDVSRITQGLITIKRERVNLMVVVEQALESAYPLIERKQLTPRMELPDRPVVVLGDPVRLEQIFMNLFTNAAKYTDPDGEITLCVKVRDGWVETHVRDTGIGISPDTHERIFTLFGQAERGLDRAQGGLGIGLTIVKNLVELHGGKIEVDSAGIGQGAEFTVTLPLCPAQDIADSTASSPGASTETPKRILIVEDSPDVAETLRMLLEGAGHDVTTVNNGPSALKKAEELEPELILLDIGLPGMDGYEVARQLRQNPHTQYSVLAALTGYGQDSDRELTQAAGFNAHFVKPVDFKALNDFINSARI